MEYPHSEISAALAYGYRGEAETAFEWLEKAYEARDASMIEIRMFVINFGPLMNDPRWHDLVARIGMSDEVADEIGL